MITFDGEVLPQCRYGIIDAGSIDSCLRCFSSDDLVTNALQPHIIIYPVFSM